MTTRMKWSLVVPALLALALAATVAAGYGAKGLPAPKGAAKVFNATDADFAAGMTPHHASGVELGRLAAERGVQPRIRELGREIIEAQTRELGILRRLLKSFAAEPAVVEPIEERDMIDMERLRQAPGEHFDRMWLDVISGHHAAAIQMAMIEESGGRNPETLELARAIIRTQSQELGEFNALTRQLHQE